MKEYYYSLRKVSYMIYFKYQTKRKQFKQEKQLKSVSLRKVNYGDHTDPPHPHPMKLLNVPLTWFTQRNNTHLLNRGWWGWGGFVWSQNYIIHYHTRYTLYCSRACCIMIYVLLLVIHMYIYIYIYIHILIYVHVIRLYCTIVCYIMLYYT